MISLILPFMKLINFLECFLSFWLEKLGILFETIPLLSVASQSLPVLIMLDDIEIRVALPRETLGEEVVGSIPAVAARSLPVGSVSV